MASLCLFSTRQYNFNIQPVTQQYHEQVRALLNEELHKHIAEDPVLAKRIHTDKNTLEPGSFRQ